MRKFSHLRRLLGPHDGAAFIPCTADTAIIESGNSRPRALHLFECEKFCMSSIDSNTEAPIANGDHGVSRRAVAKGMVWSAPVLAATMAAPTAAASGPGPVAEYDLTTTVLHPLETAPGFRRSIDFNSDDWNGTLYQYYWGSPIPFSATFTNLGDPLPSGTRLRLRFSMAGPTDQYFDDPEVIEPLPDGWEFSEPTFGTLAPEHPENGFPDHVRYIELTLLSEFPLGASFTINYSAHTSAYGDRSNSSSTVVSQILPPLGSGVVEVDEANNVSVSVRPGGGDVWYQNRGTP